MPEQVDTDADEYDFLLLVGATIGDDVSVLWEAFEAFGTWLRDGTYDGKCMRGTHIDAYHLAETVQSHRFANAVMSKILGSVPRQKFDIELTEIFRALYDGHAASSALRILYFESVIFWRMGFENMI